jgi:1-deoxy-D-xylulose-5-phosphate reductoisomerase
MAHLGAPDMRHAIGYALNWPPRLDLPVARIALAKLATLEFRAPCDTRYPALRIARDVMETGGRAGAVFNAAKEVALDGFLAGRIGFMDMSRVVEATLDGISGAFRLTDAIDTLETVLETDHLARIHAQEQVTKMQESR